MATEPAAWQWGGSADSLDEWASESWTEGELGTTGGHKPRLPGKQAPRAEPEEDIYVMEDIDVLEPGAQEETLHQNLTVSTIKMADALKIEHDEPTGGSQRAPRETQATATELERPSKQQSEGLQAHWEAEKFLILGEDTSPPLRPLSASTVEEEPEIEHFFSLDREMPECLSDVELISDSTEDHASSDSLTRDSLSEEITGDTTRSNSLQGCLDITDICCDISYEHIFSGAASERNPLTSHPHSDSDDSDHAFAIDSPPFADEGEEEEEESVDFKPLDINSLDSSSKPPQPCSSRNSISSEPDSALTQPAVPPDKQQGEQLPQNQPELAPKGVNQEAAQQVLSQDSPPLWTVAMEPANQGAAASQGSGCVVVRERNRRAGDRREVESRQKVQKESRLDRAVGGKWSTRLLEYSKKVQKQEQKKEKSRLASSKYSRYTRMESDSCDDSQSDSGVSADFSPCSTFESHTSIPTASPMTLANETPIEREIRRAIEREHSLRRSRGLQNPPTTPEYVEIPLRRSILSKSSPAQSERSQGKDKDKDRQFAGKKMQQEIHAEAQREQDLVKLGKVPGIYDKGTVRQLKERKQIFEAFKETEDSSSTISTKSKASWASASDLSTPENQEDISFPASKLGGPLAERRRSMDRLSQKQSPKGRGVTSTSLRGPGLSEGTCCRVIILDNDLDVPARAPYSSKPLQHSNSSASFAEAEALTVVDSESLYTSPSRRAGNGEITGTEEEEEDVVPKENPFFKLRSSTALVKVEQDIREAQERERELRKQRSSLYGGTGVARGRGGGGRGGERPANTERQSPTTPPPLLNGLAAPDLPASPSRGGAASPPARQSLGKLGMWPPAQAEEEQLSRPEALLSPRAPRQKSPLLQRWESGLVNGHGEEDD